MHGIDWNAIGAIAALIALGIAAAGSAGHFMDRFRTRSRIEDAIFGYKDEPGLLQRVSQCETRLGIK